MAKPKYKYFLSPSASGDLHTKAPDFERKDGGKFVLSKENLSQQDLEYLHGQGFTGLVTKVELPASASKEKDKEESPGKKGKG